MDTEVAEIEIRKTCDNGDVIFDYITVDREPFIDHLKAICPNCLEAYHELLQTEIHEDIIWDMIIDERQFTKWAVIVYLRKVSSPEIIELDDIDQFIYDSREGRDEYIKMIKSHRIINGEKSLKDAEWLNEVIRYIWSRTENWPRRVELTELKDLPDDKQVAVKQAIDLYIAKNELSLVA